MNAIKEEGVVMNAIKEDVNPTRAQLEAELARLQAEISGLEGKASAMVITVEALGRQKLEAAKSLVLSGGGSGTLTKATAALDEAQARLEALRVLAEERRAAVAALQADLAALLQAEADERHRTEVEAARVEAERLADEAVAQWEKLAFALGDLSLQIQRLAAFDRAKASSVRERISRYPRHAETLTMEALDRGCCAVTLPATLGYGDGVIVPALLRPSPAFTAASVELRVGLDAARALDLLATKEAAG